jgi:signal transduction histidine kinase
MRACSAAGRRAEVPPTTGPAAPTDERVQDLPVKNRVLDRQVDAAQRALALLKEQTEGVRSELQGLREDAAQMRAEAARMPSAQLLQANENLVLASLRAQAIADSARSRLGEMSRSASGSSPPAARTGSGDEARAEYQLRVADLREANEQLLLTAMAARELEADAQHAHSRQIKFLAMAAHELRNPLLPLRLATRRITRAASDEQELAQVQATINGQLAQMSRLIGDLLDGSRISTGKFRLDRVAVDLSAVLDQSIEAIGPAMDARGQRFERVGPVGPCFLQGDAGRLVQVFSNLLDNASKYTPERGEIRLRVEQTPEEVVITVTDSGIGISAPALPHVFDLFVQDEHAASQDSSGLGIGLAVVRELVEAHDGRVTAASAGPGQGSEFVVTLPLAALIPAP